MTAVLTSFGFYLLMIMGYISYLLFPPNVAKEKNREVNKFLSMLKKRKKKNAKGLVIKQGNSGWRS